VLMTMILGYAAASYAQGVLAPATQPARSVTLPLVEYNRLSDLANRVPIASPAAPVAAVLANAAMRIRGDGSVAEGTFTLTGRVLGPGINRVTLLNDATVFDASTEGRPLPMIVDGRSHQALLAGPGPFTANLEWGAPLVFKPGRASFMLPVPPAGAAR